MHPASRYRFYSAVFASSIALGFGGAVATSAQTMQGQNAVAPTPAQLGMADALSAMQPLLMQVNLSVSAVDVHRWKVPNDVRDTTASDVQSIQRDLSTTLPGLLTQAQNAPDAIAPAFAVFRNIDALYDVLLRITETATLAGTQSEAGRLEETRAEVQARRAQLGNAILASASAQDSNVLQLRTSLANASRVAATPAAPKKIVVEDGPAPATKTVRKRKPAAKPVTPPAPTQ